MFWISLGIIMNLGIMARVQGVEATIAPEALGLQNLIVDNDK